MTVPRRLLVIAVLLPALLAVSLAGCASSAPSALPAESGTAALPAATSPTSTPSPTPRPTLPDGLSDRIGRPALVGGEAAACIPGCARGRVAGGFLPNGRYQTEWFFGGYMTLETDGTWQRDEDSDGELSLPVSGSGEDTYRIALWLDPALVVEDRPQRVDRSAAAYVEWLAERPELRVSEPIATTVGAVPALAIDIQLADDAPRQYEDCPAACVTFLKVAAFDHSDGILGDDVYRFLFADVSYSGSDHLLAVKIEGRDQDDLAALLPRVAGLLSTVDIPARPGHVGS